MNLQCRRFVVIFSFFLSLSFSFLYCLCDYNFMSLYFSSLPACMRFSPQLFIVFWMNTNRIIIAIIFNMHIEFAEKINVWVNASILLYIWWGMVKCTDMVNFSHGLNIYTTVGEGNHIIFLFSQCVRARSLSSLNFVVGVVFVFVVFFTLFFVVKRVCRLSTLFRLNSIRRMYAMRCMRCVYYSRMCVHFPQKRVSTSESTVPQRSEWLLLWLPKKNNTMTTNIV